MNLICMIDIDMGMMMSVTSWDGYGPIGCLNPAESFLLTPLEYDPSG